MITLTLEDDEALVLFDWLARADEPGVAGVAHPSDSHALNALECVLERTLTDPLRPDYEDKLAEARGSLMARYGDVQ